MATKKRLAQNGPAELDAVALLIDRPEEGLIRGRVGMVVDQLDETTFLVEFSDDHGKMNALVPCSRSELLVLHYEPQAA